MCSIGRPAWGAVGPARLGESGGFAARGGEGADFRVTEFGEAEGEGGAIGRKRSTRILAGELGDDGAFLGGKIDDVSIAVTTFVGAVGDFIALGGKLGAVSQSTVLGELSAVRPIDIADVDLFFRALFWPGGGGKGDAAGGETGGAGEGEDEGIGELVGSATGISIKGGVDQRSTATFG